MLKGTNLIMRNVPKFIYWLLSKNKKKYTLLLETRSDAQSIKMLAYQNVNVSLVYCVMILSKIYILMKKIEISIQN